MAYNPSMYMPQAYQTVYQPPIQYQQPVNGLVSVTGIEGAKAYQMPPNSAMPLFDADSDILYLKTTDSAGYPTIREFTFHPVEREADDRQDIGTLEARIAELEKAVADLSQKPKARKAADDAQ